MQISPPSISQDHPDYALACQEALEPAIQAVISAAVAARWGEVKATEAIIALAEHRILASIENDLVAAKLMRIRETLGRG